MTTSSTITHQHLTRLNTTARYLHTLRAVCTHAGRHHVCDHIDMLLICVHQLRDISTHNLNRPTLTYPHPYSAHPTYIIGYLRSCIAERQYIARHLDMIAPSQYDEYVSYVWDTYHMYVSILSDMLRTYITTNNTRLCGLI